ncbi:MAG: DUF3769 domain-containing protein [Goleter apudmare HA4340-LM2]|jgi:hypothetical protein|nr:DUF3769 domain-containing protein [Goleter apudmare HA4340-LM2]
MLQPVLPPTPPAILKPLQPVSLVSPAQDAKFNSVVETDTGRQGNQNLSQAEGNENSLTLPTTVKATRNNLVVSQTLSTPNTPESFPPEFSPVSTSNSAAVLGEPLAIGYSVQREAGRAEQPTVAKAQISEQVTPTSASNKNLAPPQTLSINEATPLSNIKNIQFTDRSNSLVSQNVASSQPVQNVIEFTSRNSTNAQAAPSTIEFKPQVQPNPTNQPSETTPPPNTPPVRERIVEVISDQQVFDDKRRIVTAEGNVVVRFDGAVVDADRLQINLDNLIAVGEGNVALTRGDQVLRGERFTYNFIQDSGELLNGRGEIYLPTAEKDVAFLPTDITAGGVSQRPISDRIRANQPVTNVASPGGVEFTVGGTADARNIPPPRSGGAVNRLRFEAERIDFYPRGWQAKEVRITNDPFSPPELQFRAGEVTLTREAPLIDRVRGQNSRLVFDDKFAIGIPRNQQKLDRRERDVTPAIASLGFDGDLRGGLFIERGFQVVDTDRTSLSVTPQFFVQKAIQDGNANIASLFGIRTKLNVTLNSKAEIQGNGELTSLDFGEVEDNLRASLRYRQALGDVNPHLLNLEYSYRDRLYNGTLGFQTVQSSLGGVLISPVIPLGNSGINLSYQAGAQLIDANTDRLDLLEPDRENDRISLSRIQGSAALSGGLFLWQGKPLPPTPTEGLRYSPNPVVPYLRAIAGLTGTTSYYSNGDNQSTLIGTVGLEGQIGNFSRSYLDYTAFNVSYSQGLNSGLSPFLFDRSVDNKVLSAGITQQIYGPFRVGFQTSVNLDTGRESSTDYIVEYSRRTYGLTLRYNPVLELGGFSIRISDFNWSGGTDPFSDDQVKPVVGGVRQER